MVNRHVVTCRIVVLVGKRCTVEQQVVVDDKKERFE